jgi:hypothetical protein
MESAVAHTIVNEAVVLPARMRKASAPVLSKKEGRVLAAKGEQSSLLGLFRSGACI